MVGRIRGTSERGKIYTGLLTGVASIKIKSFGKTIDRHLVIGHNIGDIKKVR